MSSEHPERKDSTNHNSITAERGLSCNSLTFFLALFITRGLCLRVRGAGSKYKLTTVEGSRRYSTQRECSRPYLASVASFSYPLCSAAKKSSISSW